MHQSLKLSVANIGKSLARSPKIFIPLSDTHLTAQNVGPKAVFEMKINVNPDEILKLKDRDRKIKIVYLDVFSRTIVSEAPLTAETTEENNPRKNHLTTGNWNLILPK